MHFFYIFFFFFYRCLCTLREILRDESNLKSDLNCNIYMKMKYCNNDDIFLTNFDACIIQSVVFIQAESAPHSRCSVPLSFKKILNKILLKSVCKESLSICQSFTDARVCACECMSV